MLYRRSGLWFAAVALSLSAQTTSPLLRELPLNRFPDSKTSGFYHMPTAIEDDYFDGASSVARIRRHLAIARQIGAKYLRCAFSWNGIEKQQGKYDWRFWDALVEEAAHQGIGLIPYVAYTPEWAARDAKDFWKQPPRDPELYADFMYRIAARYRGRVRAWEIWNEPDNQDYWLGSADEFAALAKAAAAAIRRADPDAVLVLGGVSYGAGEFLRRAILDDHVDRYVDVVAMHAYPESWSNERAETVFEQWVPAVAQLIAEDRSGADLWINEMGYADYRFKPNLASIYGTEVFYRYEHTRSYQAAMLFKFFVMAAASRETSLAGWYRIDDFPASETRLGPDLVNYHLGIIDDRGRKKPAFSSVELFNRLFRTPVRLVSVTRSQSRVYVFRTSDNRAIVIAWLRSSLDSEVTEKTGTLNDPRSESVSAALPCGCREVLGYYDAEGHRLRRHADLERIPLRGGDVFIAEAACRH